MYANGIPARLFYSGHDFFEGVRAAVIDKDKSPQWLPKTLQQVSAEDVDVILRHYRELSFLD